MPDAAAPGYGGMAPARAHPRAVLAVLAAGAVAVIWLWWHTTPSIAGLGDWLTNAGRVLGLLAGYSMVVLIALMARIPPLERGIGAATLARWHSTGGRYATGLIVAHALTITWGYSVTLHSGIISQAGSFLTSYPDVLMASVGGLLLVATAIVSARAARARLRYETWYYLHFYTYLAVGLAFSHQFANGAQFVANTANRVAWSALYIAVAAAITYYRLLVPAFQALRHQLRVAEVRPEAPGVVSVLIDGRHLRGLRAEAGQFFRWRFLAPGLWWTCTPYSLSAPPPEPGGPQQLRITVKAAGDHSAALGELQPGTRVIAEGPYGALTPAARKAPKVLLVAGGIGITPLRALLEGLPAGDGDLTLLYRVADTASIVFRSELEQLARARGARLWFIAGHRADLGGDPLNAGELLKRVPGLPGHEVYVCGPDPMARSVISELVDAGVPRRRIHEESFKL